MADVLQHEAFVARVNSTFRIHTDEGETIDAELTEVSEHLLSARQERFAIVFRAPNEKFLGQGLRRLEHDQMGSFDLFIVPIGSDEKGTYYEAVFNRLRKNN
jgi:hypothetical protein